MFAELKNLNFAEDFVSSQPIRNQTVGGVQNQQVGESDLRNFEYFFLTERLAAIFTNGFWKRASWSASIPNLVIAPQNARFVWNLTQNGPNTRFWTHVKQRISRTNCMRCEGGWKGEGEQNNASNGLNLD